MAKKNTNEALKKHHFWILAGAAPLFIFLAVIFMMSGVSGAIEEQKKVINAAVTEVQGTRPPGQGVIDDYEKQKSVLQKKKGELWLENWERQKVFFSWPRGPRGEFDKYQDLKFGERLVETTNEFEVFTRNYPEMFTEMAAKVRPTRFAGGWQSVLRHVSNWGQQTPRSNQLWMALEDVWVQRAMLEPIKEVNTEIATFTLVPGQERTPLKRRFSSRVWELNIEVVDQGQNKMLKGKLKNRTGQLQLLGQGNVMRLNVWLDNRPEAPPIPFEIQGEFVPGNGEIEIPPLFNHVLLPGVVPVEIAKVMQVLDDRTVPIRRIDRLVLGYKSSMHATAELQPPAFWPEDATMSRVGGGMPGGPGSEAFPGTEPGDSGGAPGPTRGMAGTGVGGGPGGPGIDGSAGASGPGIASGPPMTVLNGNRLRYLEVTDQVRRMPVAFVIVVDQMFINDVLTAYSNSPFRFYIVQSHWKRFHGTLGASTGGGTTPGYGGGSMSPGFGRGDDGGTYADGLVGGGLFGADPYSTGGAEGAYGPGGYGMGGFGGASSTNISEAQANAGLVELTVYGVVSLYEKYDVTKDPAAEGETPAGEDPMTPDMPMGDTPTTDTPKAGDTPMNPMGAPAVPMGGVVPPNPGTPAEPAVPPAPGTPADPKATPPTPKADPQQTPPPAPMNP